MLFNYRAVMIPKYRTLFLTSSIIRYNNDGDLFRALSSNSESLLDILISDSSAVAVDSSISYRGNVLAFLAVTATLKSLFYLILCSRCYFTLYS